MSCIIFHIPFYPFLTPQLQQIRRFHHCILHFCASWHLRSSQSLWFPESQQGRVVFFKHRSETTATRHRHLGLESSVFTLWVESFFRPVATHSWHCSLCRMFQNQIVSYSFKTTLWQIKIDWSHKYSLEPLIRQWFLHVFSVLFVPPSEVFQRTLSYIEVHQNMSSHLFLSLLTMFRVVCNIDRYEIILIGRSIEHIAIHWIHPHLIAYSMLLVQSS